MTNQTELDVDCNIESDEIISDDEEINTDHLIEVKSISLKVAENNVAAIRLYEKLGFKKILKMPNYYSDGIAGFKFSATI